jgi:hypothetical protein
MYRLEDQLKKLLVRGHITNLNLPVPNLIVINGLDECDDQEGICRFIKWVYKQISVPIPPHES